jgi:hypothetical protein
MLARSCGFFRGSIIDCQPSKRVPNPVATAERIRRTKNWHSSVKSAGHFVFPILRAANRHEHRSFEMDFLITAQNRRVPLYIHRYVRFFPFRLALLRGLTMRPAPLAPSAFPAPPKEFFKSFTTLTLSIG